MVGLADVGVVVIGRNEGQRLRNCLTTPSLKDVCVVYVDSGSIDGSVEDVRRMGIDIIELDDSRPYTAARGRNAGFKHLCRKLPQPRFVQFVDGDCEIAPGWLETAVRELLAHDELAIVCGRRRERYPERSIYNRLCDMEWDTCVGEATSCGGDFMVRASAFAAVEGFDESLIAGEEPELCWRLRHAGGKVWRLPAEMTTHDADLHSFGQWWKRQVRAGHAAAENADLHGREDPKHYVRDVASNLAYGGFIPVAAGATAYYSGLAGIFLLLFVYAQLFLRVRRVRKRHGDLPRRATLYSLFTVLVKFPQTFGVLVYVWRRKLMRARSRLIEYKRVEREGSDAFRN